MTSLLKLCRSSRIALNKSHTVRWMPSTMKYFCVDSKSSSDKKSASATKPIITAMRSEYVPISERNATIILDVEEEREKMRRGEIEIEEKDDTEQYRGLNTERACDVILSSSESSLNNKIFSSSHRWSSWRFRHRRSGGSAAQGQCEEYFRLPSFAGIEIRRLRVRGISAKCTSYESNCRIRSENVQSETIAQRICSTHRRSGQ